MKTIPMQNTGTIKTVVLCLVLLFSAQFVQAAADDMSNFCSIPPFVATGTKPNLLLMIDNSASMYDLSNTDNSNYYCANAANSPCAQGSTCSGTAYCLASATTTTTTSITSSQATCSTDFDCQVLPPFKPGDQCQGTSPNKTCKFATTTVTTSTVTYTPIQCDNQANPDTYCNNQYNAIYHTSGTNNDSCNNKCNVTHSCLDNTYSPASPYIGYFTGTATYSYDFTSNKFTSVATMPGSCTYAAGSPTYLCVTSSGSPEAVTGFTATGNFLNWLTMSKFDIEKQILTGGKYDTTNQVLLAETRGCSGRKFVKLTPSGSGTATGLTFAIRGGDTSGGIKITSAATEFGQTYIEIYKGTYNAAACAAAVNDWMNVNTTNLGTTQGDTGNCIGASGNANAPLVAYNQTVHDCFWYYNGHGLTNLQVIEGNCVKDWQLVSAATITSSDAPDAMCSNQLSHPNSLVWSSGNVGYNLGFLGLCFSNGSWDDTCAYNEEVDFCASLGAQAAVTDPAANNMIHNTQSGVPGFVMESGLYNMPLIGTLTAKVSLSSPPTGLIYKYKDSILFGAMTFNNNGSGSECDTSGYCSISTTHTCSTDSDCSVSGLPTGQKCVFQIPCSYACNNTTPPFTRTCFSDNDCPNMTAGSCKKLPKTDGGHIISPIGGVCSAHSTTFCIDDANCPSYATGESCVISAGDHSAGLIWSIDRIVASSWTPFAEGFYDAIGYFARSSSGNSKDFRLQTGTCSSTPDLVCKTSSDCPNIDCNTGSAYGDYDLTKNPSSAWCRSNNILLITDGMSTTDQNLKSETLASRIASSVTGSYSGVTGYNTGAQCPQYLGSRSLPALAWAAKNRNINDSGFTSSTVSSVTPSYNNQSINTYVVYSGVTNTTANLCDASNLMKWTATNGGSSLYAATNSDQLYASLNLALGSIAAKAASGSAVSVLTTSARGVGSMLQAYFYPTSKLSSGKDLSWLGYTQNIWVDPSDNLRDDYSGNGTADASLLLNQDRVMMMNVDPASNATKVGLFTTNADGSGGTLASCTTTSTSVQDFNQIVSLWEGGAKLSLTPAGNRKIFTAIPGGTGMNTAGGLAFNVGNVSTFSAALNPDSVYTASSIVDYTLGYALEKNVMSTGSYTTGASPLSSGTVTFFRDRTLDAWSSSQPDTSVNVWKMGDVINSTPKVVGNIPQNTYFIDYGDTTYYNFISSDDYRHRSSIALIGANDGMLHAFRVGYLKDRTDNNGALGTDVKALFRDYYGAADPGVNASSANTHLGEETWAYIPYNVLPYLKYYISQQYSGCHIYGVDLTVKIYDVSIGDGSVAAATATKATDGSSWRTILIGGLRFGGACSNGTNPTSPPISGAGFSSFFALDLTDYLKATGTVPPGSPITLPKPLWEFTDAANGHDLGYTTSAPAIVRTGTSGQNGNWYVVFGSGPTQLPTSNPNRDIDRNRQGYIYILNLATGALVKKIPLNHNAVVGDVLAIDADKDYQSEKIYFGTSYKNGGAWAGKLMSIRMPSNFNVDDICGSGSGVTPTYAQCFPGDASSSLVTLFDDKFPFTASPDVARDDLGRIWVYAGSGKYNSSMDEADSSPQIFLGLIDNDLIPKTVLSSDSAATSCPSSATCASTTALCNVSSCTTKAFVPTQGGTTQVCVFSGSTSTFQTIVSSVTNAISTSPQSNAGWVIYLPFSKERVVSRPLAVGGVVDFLSYLPSSTVCTKGGNSYLYAVDYKTGAAPTNVAIRAYGSTTSDAAGITRATSGTVYIQRHVLLGPGAPPTGEAIIITPPKEGQEKLKKKIQVSTGVIVETENKPVISTISKIINWLKK